MARKNLRNGNGNGLEGFNFDNPAPKEDAKQKKIADGILLDRLNEVNTARNVLKRAQNINTHSQRIGLLKRLGYRGVYVSKCSKTVPFEKAPEPNVYRMFRKELQYHKGILDKYDKSLFGKPVLN